MIVAAALLIGTISAVSGVVERKEGLEKNEPFFEHKEDYDVLFIGSSHVINGIYPMQLWNDQGIVSYNLGGHGNRIPASYWVMMMALQYTTPRLIVLDCWGIQDEKLITGDHESIHQSFDAFPLSRTKVDAVWDLFEDDLTRMEIIWKYSIYHNRWKDITEEDFTYKPSCEKGAEYRIGLKSGSGYCHTDTVFQGDTPGTEYLVRIIQECKKRQIDLLLINLPYNASEEEAEGANRVGRIAGENGIDYLDMMKLDIVDPDTDYYDDSHLNPKGAEKATRYLGQYLTEKYHIPDQRDNAAYAYWYDEYDEYSEFKKKCLSEEESMASYLMLLSDEGYDARILVNNDKIYDNPLYSKLLDTAGVCEDAADTGQEPDLLISVYDRETGDIIDRVGFTFDTKDDIEEDSIVTTGAYR